MAERPTAGDYLKVLRASVPTMVTQIKELAAAELKPAVKNGGVGAGLFGGAAVIGITALKLFLLTGAFALSMIYAEVLGRNPLTALTLGFLTMSVLALIIVAVLALLGKGKISKVKAPEATIAETKASLSAVADAIENGVTDVHERRIPNDALQVTAGAKLPARLDDPDGDWVHPKN